MKNRFICAEEVAQELSVSKPYAYKLIRQLNEELKAKEKSGKENHAMREGRLGYNCENGRYGFMD